MSHAKHRINSANLPTLCGRLRVPAYDRGKLAPAIVHIGVGGFNRAHQASYLDDLLHHNIVAADAHAWGECGVGLLPGDKQLEEVLCAQDFLYTLVERSAHGRQARIIGSICDFLYAPANPEAAIEKMSSPQCRIVSMTITEGGYLIDRTSGGFEDRHPSVLYDLEHPAAPRTFAGYVVEALSRRRARGLPPFTMMSCDNVPGNGHTTRTAISAFAELRDPGLRAWIEANVAFPNSMVDRITPATTAAERMLIGERFGIGDGWPVFTEPFRQWVLEDTFCNGRPALDLVGVQFTADVTPFELMKVRLLNGSHFALAYPAALLGFEFVHDALGDELLRTYIQAFMEAVTPAVPPPPHTDLKAYKAVLIERFGNPNLRDQVERVCSEGSSKLPKFILSSAQTLLASGRPATLLALVVATWLRYLGGADEQGRPMQIRDADAAPLQILLGSSTSLDAIRSVLGETLRENESFVAQTGSFLEQLRSLGVGETLRRALALV